jgi:putative NADH-flavin reductase
MATNTFAIIGSTGNCGSAIIQNLLQSPQNKVHAYCRNATKLYRLLPEVTDNKRVQVFPGSFYDLDLITDCVRGTDAVFLTLTTNDNMPGCRLSLDSASIVIQALQRIKAESGPGIRLPRLVLLSSATIDDHLARDMPGWFRPIMLTAASYVYDDLKRAEALLRSHEDWLSTIFIKPAGLSPDVPRGHRLTLDEEESFISYMDLAAGMIEAASDEEGRYHGRNVGVVNAKRGVGAKFPKGTPLTILLGLTRHYFPWLHPYLPSTGPN